MRHFDTMRSTKPSRTLAPLVFSLALLWCCADEAQHRGAAQCGRTTDAGAPICCGRGGELPGFSCVDLAQDGGEYGIYGRCIERGQTFDAKIVGARCCEGLVRVDSVIETGETSPGYPEGCGPGPTPPSTKLCVQCGDGTCGDQENRCNCAQDCQ